MYILYFAIRILYVAAALSSIGSTLGAVIEIENADPLRLAEKLTSVEAGVDTIIITTTSGWLDTADKYISSGAAAQIDEFLSPYIEWNVDESLLYNWTQSTSTPGKPMLTLHRSKTPHMAAFSKWWREFQFDPHACSALKVIGGGSGPFGSWAYPIMDEHSRSMQHGLTITPYPNFKGWYLGDMEGDGQVRRRTICGETGNVWECLFLKWHNCDVNKLLHHTHGDSNIDESQRSAANKLLGTASGWSGEACIVNNHIHLCKSFEPCYPNITQIPMVSRRRADISYNSMVAALGSVSMERLIRYTLIRRFTYRLRRMIARETSKFYAKYPSFPRPLQAHEVAIEQGEEVKNVRRLRQGGGVASQGLASSAAPSTSTCAALQIRHGDKMCDEWLHLHHTSSFFFDLDRAVAEAVALLPKDKHKEILLITDDLDIVVDAMSPSTQQALDRADISIAIAPGSEVKHSTRCLLCHPAGMTEKHWTSWPGENMQCPGGDHMEKHWGNLEIGVEELARILSVEEIGKACTGFVANCDSGFVSALWRDMCAGRADISCIPHTFSFGENCPNDAATDKALARTCDQPCANETLCKKVGHGPRVCNPPTPAIAGLESLSRWTPIIRSIGVIP